MWREFLDYFWKMAPDTSATAPAPCVAITVEAVITAINQQRFIYAKPLLVKSDTLCLLAQSWAAIMAGRKVLSYDGLDNRIVHVMASCGGLDAAIASWMARPAHREDILGPYSRVGVGWAISGDFLYWCIDFDAPGT